MTNDAAKPDCILPMGDDGSLNEGCSSGEIMGIKINETLLSTQQSSNCVNNANTGNHTLISEHSFKKYSTWVSLFKRNDSLAKLCFS